MTIGKLCEHQSISRSCLICEMDDVRNLTPRVRRAERYANDCRGSAVEACRERGEREGEDTMSEELSKKQGGEAMTELPMCPGCGGSADLSVGRYRGRLLCALCRKATHGSATMWRHKRVDHAINLTERAEKAEQLTSERDEARRIAAMWRDWCRLRGAMGYSEPGVLPWEEMPWEETP